MLTSEQVRAARAFLRMEQSSLAEKAKVSVETVKRIESMVGPIKAQHLTIQKIQRVFEMQGIEFSEKSDEAGPGLRMAADKQQRLRRDVAALGESLIDAILKTSLLDDPTFLERDVNVIVDRITQKLPGLLKHTLPNTLRGFPL